MKLKQTLKGAFLIMDTANGGFFGATAKFILEEVKKVEAAGGEFYLLKLTTAS